MKISILGTGYFGTAIGKALAHKHEIIYGSRTPANKTEWVKTIGQNVSVVSYKEAAASSKIILVALNWAGDIMLDTLRQIEFQNDTILIDVSNVINPDFSPRKFQHANSGAEEIKRLFPQLLVVKAFNTASGYSINNNLLPFSDTGVTGFYCGDDQGKKIAAALLSDAGFQPLDSGDLSNACYLESLGQFLISLAFKQNLGVEIGWALLQKSV